MLSNKEIRHLQIPQPTPEIEAMVKNSLELRVMVVTCEKVATNIHLNFFGTDEDNKVKCLKRYFVSEDKHEARLFDLQKNKIANGYVLRSSYYGSTVLSDENEFKKLKEYTAMEDVENIKTLIMQLECTIAAHRAKEKRDEKEKVWAKEQEAIKAIPKSFVQTVRRTVQKYSSYLFFDRKEGKVFCSACEGRINISSFPKFKEREIGECPLCKRKLPFASKNKRKKTEFNSVVLVQSAGQRKLVSRYFQIVISHTGDTFPTVKTSEVLRSFCDYTAHTVEDYEYVWWNDHMCWRPPMPSIFCPSGYHYSFYKGLIHPYKAELKKAQLVSTFEFSRKAKKALEGKDPTVLGKTAVFEKIAKHPVAEKAVKVGLFNLVPYLTNSRYYFFKRPEINEEGSSLVTILGLRDKAQLKEAINLNISEDDLYFIHKNNQYFPFRTIEEVKEITKGYQNHEEEALQLSSSFLKKLTKYIPKIAQEQEISIQDAQSDYFDYIKNVKKLGYDTKSEFICFPKNFIKAHNEAYLATLTDNKKESYEKIQKLLPKMHEDFDYYEDEFFIRAPRSGQEITLEGHLMHHCVHSYVDSVADEKTNILFCRKTSNPDKPFVTVEFKDGHIVQKRAKCNGTPPKEAIAFLERWEAKII